MRTISSAGMTSRYRRNSAAIRNKLYTPLLADVSAIVTGKAEPFGGDKLARAHRCIVKSICKVDKILNLCARYRYADRSVSRFTGHLAVYGDIRVS